MKFENSSIKTFVIIGVLSFVIILYLVVCGTFDNKTENYDGVNILVLASKNYGLNSFINRDLMEQFGWNLTYTGVLDSINACPPVEKQLGVPPIIPDFKVDEIDDLSKYDGIFIPPGSGSYYKVPNAFGDLLSSPAALKIISDAVKHDKAVFATCSGLRVLAAADVLMGREVVGAPEFKDEYEAAGAKFLGKNHAPSISGNVITTARDLYNNYVNMLAISTVIENRKYQRGTKNIRQERFILSGDYIYAGNEAVWAKTFGGKGADGGKAICETDDGGFLITGYTFSEGSSDADMLVLKIDSQGNEDWTKVIGGRGAEYAYGCIKVKDGYLVTGYTTSFGAGSKDVYLIRLDKRGNEIWSKTYGGESWDVGMSVCKTGDGGYAVCGFTHSFGNGEEDIYLIKTDSNGKEIWSKTYGGERYEIGNSVFLTEDNGFLLAGTTGTYGKGNCDYYLIKTDSNGEKIWAKPFGTKGRRGYGYDWCSSGAVTSDKGIILTGQTDFTDLQDALVFKIDSEGNEEWKKPFGNNPYYDYGSSIFETKDGGYLIAGMTKSIEKTRDTYNNDAYLVKIDSEGNIIQTKSFGGGKSEWINSAVLTEEGDILALGQTASSGNGSYDILVLKIQSFSPGRFSHFCLANSR